MLKRARQANAITMVWEWVTHGAQTNFHNIIMA